MKYSIEGLAKVAFLLALAMITGWTIVWVIFWIMFIMVGGAHIWIFFNPLPTPEGKIRALRQLLESEVEKDKQKQRDQLDA